MQQQLYKLILAGIAILMGSFPSFAQPCTPSESTVIIEVLTDNYGYECSWEVTGNNGTTTYATGGTGGVYANSTLYRDTVCVPSSSCTQFTIFDSFGDGICCAHGNGYFSVTVDGVVVGTGGNYTSTQTVDFNCPPGSACTSADTINVGGPYTASYDDHWYSFTPDSNGMYAISTCGFNTCNTKIWVYDNCGALIGETNAGTVFYDDNSGGCGNQAVVSAALSAGTTYLIRIGDSNNNCTGNVLWSLSYNGPISGCTDPTACNYNPLATVSDTCVYPGSPDCPTGPDLVLREDVLRSSMYVTTYNSTDPCQVTEQCINGMGTRNLVRFTTHIENNGTQDYYVGNPTANPNQFSNNNCHGHYHYEGYAEYILYDVNLVPIPIGFKSGFCVMDLICQNGGSYQYGCGNQGITAGCGDIYDASLDCQWIDITTVPDGDYVFVARVNWDFSPDALGRYELSYANNWGQVCFNLSRQSGAPQITVNTTNCPVFTDCAGQPYGSAVPDCNGNCNGGAIRGNINADGVRDGLDVTAYLTQILQNSINPTDCNDIFRDTTINIYDVALINNCLNDTAQCNFPNGITNIFDTAYLSIGAYDLADNYIDIYMRNPDNRVLGYQFTMGGITIDTVVSLASVVEYPENPQYAASTSRVLALSLVDSTINRSQNAQPLCRIYYSNIISNEICIESIESIVSNIYQDLMTGIEGPCIMASNTPQTTQIEFTVNVAPNPMNESTTFRFNNPSNGNIILQILDVTGKTVRSYNNLNGNEFTLQREGLPAGMYLYRLQGELGSHSGKLLMK